MSHFDQFAERYDALVSESIKLSGYPPSYFDEYKVREMSGALLPEGIAARSVRLLNFGCGIGRSERYLRRFFPNAFIHSIDTSAKSIAIARENNIDLDNVRFSTFDGVQLPFDMTYDIVFSANVFHHILPKKHEPILTNIRGRLAAGGSLFLFEHNPYNPLTRRAVRSCLFDRDAVLLHPRYALQTIAKSGFPWSRLRFIVFFPAVLRMLSGLERFMHLLPLGAQYYVWAKKELR